MDQEAGAWLVMAMLASMYRVIDLSNPRLRRLWNGAAACLLVAGWNLEGTSPESYAWMLVLTGAVLLVLALLDLWLLLHLAVTPLAPDPEDAHA